MFEGLKVLEVATGLAGPVVTSWLGGLGADVIKIESRSGDPLRRCEPAAFATWNRAKRSVVLDLDTEDGRTALGRLVGEADVFVHGWTEREATELGLDDGTLGRLHPSLIVAR